MSRQQKPDEVLDECGLTLAAVGASAARVFGLVAGREIEPGTPGWAAVANYAAAMFRGGMNDDSPVAWADFAAMLRKAFAAAEAPDAAVADFSALRPEVRTAWTAVARHLVNVFNFEREEAGRIEAHERRMAAFALSGFKAA